MSEIALIFPHQLFDPNPLLENAPAVALIEDSLFFGDAQYPARFHKQKLMLHRASMQQYAQQLRQQGLEVSYLEYAQHPALSKALHALKEEGHSAFRLLDPVDFMLEKRLRQFCEKQHVALEILPSPGFLNSREENQQFFQGKKRYFMADYYQHQRKRLGILLEDDGESPVGGKWSFDEENRKKVPKKLLKQLPQLPRPVQGEAVEEARKYVEKHFADNYGQTDAFFYPTTHQAARAWLDDFLAQRFAQFGPYEDAIVEGESLLYHSLLTPMLNIGLLQPKEIVDRALGFAEKEDIPLASLEGFIRQIIGWREYMRVTYEDMGVEMRTSNYWQHENPMPEAFYTAETGIPPIDDTIRRILKTGYCHHIERLMVLGGFMFLCRIHPKEIYRWFMEMFIDSYDWVMVPNVYAMSQNSAGGLITTKPYFSGSNYVRKMSHYRKDDWCATWDGMYWKFIFDHSEALAKNPRWAMMVATGRRMAADKRQAHEENAEAFLEKMNG